MVGYIVELFYELHVTWTILMPSLLMSLVIVRGLLYICIKHERFKSLFSFLFAKVNGQSVLLSYPSQMTSSVNNCMSAYPGKN